MMCRGERLPQPHRATDSIAVMQSAHDFIPGSRCRRPGSFLAQTLLHLIHASSRQ